MISSAGFLFWEVLLLFSRVSFSLYQWFNRKVHHTPNEGMIAYINLCFQLLSNTRTPLEFKALYDIDLAVVFHGLFQRLSNIDRTPIKKYMLYSQQSNSLYGISIKQIRLKKFGRTNYSFYLCGSFRKHNGQTQHTTGGSHAKTTHCHHRS